MNKITRKIIALNLAVCLAMMLGVSGVALAEEGEFDMDAEAIRAQAEGQAEFEAGRAERDERTQYFNDINALRANQEEIMRTVNPPAPDVPSGEQPPASSSAPTSPLSGSGGSAGAAQSDTRTRSIQETFNVNKYLTTEGQTSKVQIGIVGFATEIIGRFVQIIGSISLVIFIIGAIMTITSEGKEDRLEKGKTAMIYSLIGLVIALFSFIIVAFVQSVLF